MFNQVKWSKEIYMKLNFGCKMEQEETLMSLLHVLIIIFKFNYVMGSRET